MKINILIYILVLLELGVINTYSATYIWNGSAKDGKWNTADNWTVTGSEYTWPNEQKNSSYINDNCDQIIIDNGDSVTRATYLSIDGPLDASVAPALILDNGSKLTVDDSIYLANALGALGQIGIRDGATLDVRGKILDVGNDGDGSVIVSNGRLIIEKALQIGSGKYAGGYMVVSGHSTITVGKEMILSYFQSAKSELIINDGKMIINGRIVFGGGEASCRLFLNGGVLQCTKLKFNHNTSRIIYTGGLLVVNADNLSEKAMQELVNSGKIDVSGAEEWKISTKGGYTVLGSEAALDAYTVPVPAVTEIQKVKYTWIGGSGGMDDDTKWSTGRTPVKDSHFLQDDCEAVIISGSDAKVTDYHFSINLKGVCSKPVFTIENGASLTCENAVWLANDYGTVGKMIIKSGADVKIRNLIDIGNDGTGELEIDNASLAVTGSKMGIRIGPNFTSVGNMTVSGKSTVTSAGYLHIGTTLQGNATLTINDGTVTINGAISFGVSDGKNSGKHRIYLRGGKLQGDNLIFRSTDSKVVYTGGELLVNSKKLSEADMKKLINSGKIDVSGTKKWRIITLDGFTVLGNFKEK